MTDALRIFLGHDRRFPEPSQVLAHSIRRLSSRPVDIRFLDLDHLRECYGFRPQADPRATTEFTYSRFLVPWLCGYEGVALFLDNDMLALDNVAKLFAVAEERPRPPYALWCVQHDHRPVDGSPKMGGVVQTAYPRKNWSSVMLMDCGRLKCWTKAVVESADGPRLHRFADIPDEKIGWLDPRWNVLDDAPPDAGIAHWTSGMLWNDARRTWPRQEVWLAARARWLAEHGRPADTSLPSQHPAP